MNTAFQPPVEIPANVLEWMRATLAAGNPDAFIAAMWNQYQRTGGVTANQLAMIEEEMGIDTEAQIAKLEASLVTTHETITAEIARLRRSLKGE